MATEETKKKEEAEVATDKTASPPEEPFEQVLETKNIYYFVM
jgi:hypothetical protein